MCVCVCVCVYCTTGYIGMYVYYISVYSVTFCVCAYYNLVSLSIRLLIVKL